ncbi:MAG: hypothetical protein WCP92_07160 [bacterium]
MNPILIKNKIEEVSKAYNIAHGGNDMQLTIQIHYPQHGGSLWMEIGDLTPHTREWHREACENRLKDMLGVVHQSIQTSRTFDLKKPDKIGAIKCEEGVVVMAGIGYLVSLDILAVALYKLKLITKENYHKIKEELGVENSVEDKGAKFWLLEHSVK